MATRHQAARLPVPARHPYSAAVYAARANLNPVLITGICPGRRPVDVPLRVDDWPADADGVQGLSSWRFEKHALRFNTEMIFDHPHHPPGRSRSAWWATRRIHL